jgi:hypothetical protein
MLSSVGVTQRDCRRRGCPHPLKLCFCTAVSQGKETVGSWSAYGRVRTARGSRQFQSNYIAGAVVESLGSPLNGTASRLNLFHPSDVDRSVKHTLGWVWCGIRDVADKVIQRPPLEPLSMIAPDHPILAVDGEIVPPHPELVSL